MARAQSVSLFPYRLRPGQDQIVEAIGALARTGGALLVDAATGSGKTVAAVAPLLEHAERADHKILYLVRTHAQEVQVLSEVRAISHRSERPILALGLQGRQRRCLLLEGLPEMKGATAEEYGKLCADRKRSTENALEGKSSDPPLLEIPEGTAVDLTDLEGCPYYARVLQADLDGLTERFASRLPSNAEYESYCRTEYLCPYELSKKLVARARLITAPYAFFFHPHVRGSLLSWLGVDLSRVDLVIDEAHHIPDYLRDLSTVSLPLDSVRRARAEVTERGEFALGDGLEAGAFLDLVGRTVERLIEEYATEEDGVLPPTALEAELLGELRATSHRLDTLLGSLVSWGETVREERRREKLLPRSAVHTVALTLLSWPQLEPPAYVKVATREPRPAVEAYALDAIPPAAPIRDCHLSVHLSGTLAPLEEYRDALGLGDETRLLPLPPPFPPEHRRFFYDSSVTTRFEELTADPTATGRIADRIAAILPQLPVKTALFFPSFALMEKVLAAGLSAALPGGTVVESRSLSMGDLWRSIEGFKAKSGAGLIVGVVGGRIAEGVDFPDEELEAIVLVGIPFPRPTAKREALRAFIDLTTGHGWEYCVDAPAQRAMVQAIGRMIRSEHDRGVVVLLDRRATQFASLFPGLEPVDNLGLAVRQFFGRRRSRRPRSARSPGEAGPESVATREPRNL